MINRKLRQCIAIGLSALGWTLSSSVTELEAAEGRPVRILFLGHDSEHHNSNEYYPMLSQALGRDAIYFDYETEVDQALDPEYLSKFDGVLLYANHTQITPDQLKALIDFVESGKGFIPVHCASACFPGEKDFIHLVGGKFLSHGGEVFSPKIIKPEHPALSDVEGFEAWDETYVHSDHSTEGREVLMVREEEGKDPEPWTWVRQQGKGRVFYTASGHDQRVWRDPGFHQLLKSGILWAIGDEAKSNHQKFLHTRTPLEYVKRDNIPNYERRPEPLPYQQPLSPADSLDYLQAPVGFKVQLFASEPMIINPICLAWDERGRLWVGETVDYPNEVKQSGGRDTIKILEDTDGDGKADKVTVFADNLNIPTSLVLVDGGAIVAQAPDFVFLQDTDGDDVADVRKVLLSGWGKSDTHAGPSNLRYGVDNWIYGTVGYAGYNGQADGSDQRFGMGAYRMKKDGSGLEFLYQFNNNTWGLGFNNAGDVFGSTANNNPSFFGGIPATLYGEGQRGMTAKMIADSPRFHPITPNIRQVDAFGAYTAGCGHAFATSDGFPERYRDRIAFVNGPTGNLVGRYRVEDKGAGYVSKNAFAFLASADEWFSPVASEVGPDGALWVADWYNFIIQHNPTPNANRGGYDAVNGAGNAYINPIRDKQHGRIYRVVWEGAPESSVTSLDGACDDSLLAALSSSNQLWRLTAQRLIVEGEKTDTVPALKRLISEGGIASIHAFWALDGLWEMNQETMQTALLSSNASLRRNAIRMIGTNEEAVQLYFDSAVATDPDLHTRLVAFNKLVEFEPSDIIRTAVRQLQSLPENRQDEWLTQSLKLAAAKQGVQMEYQLGVNIIPNPSMESFLGGDIYAWESRRYSGAATETIADNVAHSGSHSLRIESGSGSDTSWKIDVDVEPNTEYRLSGWIKTSGISGAMGALLNVHGTSATEGATKAVSGNSDWTEVSLIFNSGGRRQVSINCLFGGWGWAKGEAWYDDIALQKISYGAAAKTAAIQGGNADRGLKLFKEHPVASCVRCHQVGGEGGVVGPALDGIATRKAKDYIYTSLVDPNAAIAEGFQLEASPMPPMGILLEPQDLEDLMAYLMTLTEK